MIIFSWGEIVVFTISWKCLNYLIGDHQTICLFIKGREKRWRSRLWVWNTADQNGSNQRSHGYLEENEEPRTVVNNEACFQRDLRDQLYCPTTSSWPSHSSYHFHVDPLLIHHTASFFFHYSAFMKLWKSQQQPPLSKITPLESASLQLQAPACMLLFLGLWLSLDTIDLDVPSLSPSFNSLQPFIHFCTKNEASLFNKTNHS